MKEQLDGYKPYIHYDKDMEGAILGACLLELTAFGRIRGLLYKECFYTDGHQKVYEAISEMWEKNYPVDCYTVSQFIVRNKNITELDGDNVSFHITRLTNSVVSTANLEYHSLMVRQLYAERELLRIRTQAMDGDVLQRTEQIRDELFKLTQIKVVDDWSDIIDVVLKLHKHMDDVYGKDFIGVPTGFEQFDLVTGGFCKSDLIIIAARPSVGKSAFLGAVTVHAAKNNFQVGIISLEMSDLQLGARMGSLVSDIEFYKIFRNKLDDDIQRDKLYRDLETLSNLPIKITDKTGVNINDIRAKVGNLIAKGKLDILFVDYLQLLDSDEGNRNYNREQEVSKMSRGFKLIAKEFNIPVVVLAQLNRESEKLSDKKPKLHHLRESGAIEQDADLVVFLHRDFQSGIIQNEQGQSTENEADLIVAKGRNIEKPEIKIGFDGTRMRFYDKERQPSFTQTNHQTWKPFKED